MRKAATVLLYTSLFTLSLGVTGLRALEIPLRVKEFDGFTRRAEPATAGVILPRSAVKESESLCLYSADGEPVPCQFETTGRTALLNGCWWTCWRTARPADRAFIS